MHNRKSVPIHLLSWSAVLLLMACSLAGQIPFLATPTPLPTPTPIPTATPVPHPPEITKLDLKEKIENGEQLFDILISFRDLDGDAVKIHYEILKSTASGLNVEDGYLNNTKQSQKAGTTATGNWGCGNDTYDVTLGITIIDAKRLESEQKSITIPCDVSRVIPTYSQVVAAYPPGTETCNSVVDITGMNGDKLNVTIHTLSIYKGQISIRCPGTKVTLLADVTLDGVNYEAGTLLTVDENNDWIVVSSWD